MQPRSIGSLPPDEAAPALPEDPVRTDRAGSDPMLPILSG